MTPHGLERNRLVCPWRFSRQEYWSGLPFCPPWDLPNPGIEPSSLTLQTGSLPSEPPGNYMLLFSRSVVSDSVTQWIAACQASPSFTISQSLLKLMLESVMPSNHLILCHFLMLLPSMLPRIMVFCNELALPSSGQSRSFSFSISPSNDIQG